MHDDEIDRPVGGQSAMRFDDSPERFRKAHGGDEFSGSSGVLFEQAMAQTRMAICLADPHQEDMPIVFANRAFTELTGYEEDEIVGRNCRFLQGIDTAEEPVRRIREAIIEEDVIVVELLNYRKDGTAFWNALHLGPIYDEQGKLKYFFGSQWDVSDVKAARSEERHAKQLSRELSHRMKNMFAVISGIVNITGRVHGIQQEAAEINARIQALGRAYETTLDDASTNSINIGEAIRAMLEPYGEEEGSLVLEGNGTRVPFQVISVVGVVLHELAANSVRHGAWAVEGGKVCVDWRLENGHLVIDWRESGVARENSPNPADGTGFGIIDRILRHRTGSIEKRWNKDGLEALVTVNTNER